MADSVNTGFDPLFGDPLRRFRAALEAAGIDTRIISGVRNPDQHQQAWDNYLATMAGRPLPHPDFGPVTRATPPGQVSTHDVGLGADVVPVDRGSYPKMWAMAPQFGLSAQGSGDPAHFNLADWRAAQATQGQPTPWSRVADLPTTEAQNIGAGVLPGTTLSTSSPMDLVANLESGNRNIPQSIVDVNTAKGTPAGGYFQIIDPTWQRYAPTAGIDVKQFPFAMAAPRDIQAQVAGAIPVSQWGANTVSALKAKYPWIDTSQTLGQVQSRAQGQAPGPIDPSIIAHGGSGPPVPSGAPIGTGIASTSDVLPGFGSKGASDAFTKGVSTLDKAFGGKGQAQGGQGGGEGGEGGGSKSSPMIQGPPAVGVSPLLAQAPALYGQTLNSLSAPPQWGSAPPGVVPYAGAGTGAPTAPIGTSLASLQQLQALMSIDPYGEMSGYG